MSSIEFHHKKKKKKYMFRYIYPTYQYERIDFQFYLPLEEMSNGKKKFNFKLLLHGYIYTYIHIDLEYTENNFIDLQSISAPSICCLYCTNKKNKTGS